MVHLVNDTLVELYREVFIYQPIVLLTILVNYLSFNRCCALHFLGFIPKCCSNNLPK